jgi:hypothetical protein
VLSLLLVLGSGSLPWYGQSITLEQSGVPSNSSYVDQYYQAFYIYHLQNCPDVNCTLVNSLIVTAPTTEGISLWKLNSQEPTMYTRIVFLICWLCQLSNLIFLPLAFSVEKRSSWASMLGFVAAGISVVVFIFIPSAMKLDLGDECFNASYAHNGHSPCNSLSKKEDLFGSQVQVVWGPSLGFYLALAAFGLIGVVFMLTVYLKPCRISKLPSFLKWMNPEASDVEDSQSFKEAEGLLGENHSRVNSSGFQADFSNQANLSDHFFTDESR